MSLPHFFTTMAFFKTTKTVFFLNMAQIYDFGTFLYPIKRVTLFRHVLWTQICGLVMLWCGTVISRCDTVIHFFMTMPHLYMSTTSFHMTNPHIKWLWHNLKWTWRKHKWIRLSLLWQWHLLWLCQKKFVAQSFIFVATSLHYSPTSYLICTPWHFYICMCHKNYDFATFTFHHDKKQNDCATKCYDSGPY